MGALPEPSNAFFRVMRHDVLVNPAPLPTGIVYNRPLQLRLAQQLSCQGLLFVFGNALQHCYHVWRPWVAVHAGLGHLHIAEHLERHGGAKMLGVRQYLWPKAP